MPDYRYSLPCGDGRSADERVAEYGTVEYTADPVKKRAPLLWIDPDCLSYHSNGEFKEHDDVYRIHSVLLDMGSELGATWSWTVHFVHAMDPSLYTPWIQNGVRPRHLTSQCC